MLWYVQNFKQTHMPPHHHVLFQLDSIIWEKLQDGAGDSLLPLVMVMSVQLPQTQVGACRW